MRKCHGTGPASDRRAIPWTTLASENRRCARDSAPERPQNNFLTNRKMLDPGGPRLGANAGSTTAADVASTSAGPAAWRAPRSLQESVERDDQGDDRDGWLPQRSQRFMAITSFRSEIGLGTFCVIRD